MSVNKEINLKFIKEFSKITIAAICKELGIDKSNLWRGNASEEAVKKVREEIEKRIHELDKLK
jgi:hypothetical protein